MTISVLLISGIVGAAVGALAVWSLRKNKRRDPVEYFSGWSGYHHPIAPGRRITKQKAEALAAEGAAYLIGYFDTDGKLTRIVKLLRGEFLFEYAYTYHPNGRLKSARVTRGGRVTLLEYDERGRRLSGQGIAF
jgi:uncharacterized protein DUF6156/RHS repeat protein